MSLIIFIGILSFVGFFLIVLFMLPRSSAQSVLLDEVTRQTRELQNPAAQAARPAIDVDWLAKPFTLFRRLFSSEPDPDLVRRLMLAGYRKPAHVDIFLGARLVLPVALGCLSAILFSTNLFLFLMTLVVGFFIPDFWLNVAVKKRREKIRLSLPDGLDLLAICIEAGLGLDQGIVRVGNELRVSHPELSEEFLQINLEQRAGATRIAAWQSFSGRADTESVRSFVAMLVQTDRFGTPIAKSLGNFSDTLRTQRRQRAEELAAKTTIKLIPPLVFFIFPSIGIVILVPAAISILENLKHLAD
ncbi:MAG: type II secretion system F family protein [Terriglobales bacterium]